MMNCNRIQRLIDEAEHNHPLSFEASLHLDACQACCAFADERLRLREMLGTLPSITVPANFNGQLKARLEEVKAKRSLTWLSPAVYLRFGTATALLLVGVFAIQYSGIFTDTKSTPEATLTANRSLQPTKPPAVVAPPQTPAASDEMAQAPKPTYVKPQPLSANNRRLVRLNSPRRDTAAVADGFDMPDSSIRPFSVGAQDRFYTRADNATPVRTVSF